MTEQEIIARAEKLINHTNLRKHKPQLVVKAVYNKKSYLGYAGKDHIALTINRLAAQELIRIDAVIVHEIAHHYTEGHGHDSVWKKCAADIWLAFKANGIVEARRAPNYVWQTYPNLFNE
jgi:predicted SprT family Zn-dependent metalloprotease